MVVKPTDVKLVAITTTRTPQSRLLFLENQRNALLPYDLTVMTMHNVASSAFQTFRGTTVSDTADSVLCLLYNTLWILQQFVDNDEAKYVCIVEDDAQFCTSFAERFTKALNAWTSTAAKTRPSHVLRIGFLPNVCRSNSVESCPFGLLWPKSTFSVSTILNAQNSAPICTNSSAPIGTKNSDAQVNANLLYGVSQSQDRVHFRIQYKCIGAQAIVYSREGAKLFLRMCTKNCEIANLRYDALLSNILELPMHESYQTPFWKDFSKQYVPATDHLLNTECLNQALVLPPLVVESKEGRTSSQCNSMSSKSIWSLAVQQGFSFESF